MSKVDLVAHSREVALEPPLSARPSLGELPGIAGRVRAAFARLSDQRLATLIGVVLFALAAWPVALTEVPPFQDLPNHLAAVTVISHPDKYPEFVSNGFLKTNAALFTWLYFVGKVVGAEAAARLFTLLVLAANAFVLPRFVLHFAGEGSAARGRGTLITASFFLWPMIHNWFVSMGMLDFAMGIPLALGTLVLLDKQRKAPSAKTAAMIAAASVATWYAHVFGLLVVNMLVLVHVVQQKTWAARLEEGRRMWLPQIPAVLLTLISVYKHVTEPVGEMTGYVNMVQLLPPWELLYNAWAEWFYGFTWLSIGSFVPALVLAIYGFLGRRQSPTFFSPAAMVLLLVLFIFTPYIATNWFHFNSRFIPFLWFGLLLRLPSRLPWRLAGLLGVACATYTAGMGIDYVRLDADRAKFTAGMSVVPEGAKLLPLVFKRKLTSENTRSLLHAWGFYVMEKQTSAPLLFAHSRSFPVMYRQPPPPRFNHLVLESFAPSMGTPSWMCDVLRGGGVMETDCEGAWRRQWHEFWTDATPRFDHVLMWDAPEEARDMVPPSYRLVFQQDRLAIYERVDGP